jgi:hypothetical protein
MVFKTSFLKKIEEKLTVDVAAAFSDQPGEKSRHTLQLNYILGYCR